MAVTLRTAIARATVQGFAAEALVFPVGIITAAYLTRNLGPSRYGLVSLIYAAVSPVAWLAATTFAGRAGVKLLTDAAEWRAIGAALLRANLLLGGVAMALFAVAVPALVATWNHSELASYCWLAGLEIALFPVIRLHRDALLARGDYAWPAVVTATFHAARLVGIVALVTAGLAVEGVIVANLLARGVELIVCRRRLALSWEGARPGVLSDARHLFSALFVYSVAIQLFNRIDVLMIGWMGVAGASIGHYGAAQSVAQAPGLFALVFAPLLIASLRRAAQSGPPGRAEMLRAGSGRLALALWAFAGPVAGGSDGLAILLFGRAFSPAGAILGWLSIAGGASVVVAVWSAHEVASERYYRPLSAAIPMLLGAIGLDLLWIPAHGAIGAAWATASAAGLGAVIALGVASDRRRFESGRDLARAAVAGAAGWFAARLVAGWNVWSPLDALVGCAVTGGGIGLTGLVSSEDLRRTLAGIAGRESLEPEGA